MVPHTPDQVDPGLAVPPDVLAVDPELMRALGYAVVDRTVDHLLNLGELPAIREGSPSELRDVIGGPLPAQPHDLEADLSLLADTVLTHQQHGDHPRYFARVAGPSSFPGVLAAGIGVQCGVNDVHSVSKVILDADTGAEHSRLPRPCLGG
jgi:hypothetical protein